MDDNTFRELLRQRGFAGPELIERNPNTHNAEHTHEFAVSALILEGELSVTTARGTTTCRAGDLFELEGGIPHSEQYGPAGARVLVGRHG